MITRYFYFPDENDYSHFSEVTKEEARYKGTDCEILVAVTIVEDLGSSARVMYDDDGEEYPASHEVFSSDLNVDAITMARALVAAARTVRSCSQP